MPKRFYVAKNFQAGSRQIINKANEIIAEYAAEGFDLTLRQLYYQFVAKDLFANNEKNYDRLGAIISDARLAGLIDWNAIKDRMRSVEELNHFDDPAEIVRNAAHWYTMARWEGQSKRVEVWIEKDALVGTIRNVCVQYDVPYLACRGYASQTAMWDAAQRFAGYYRNGQQPVVIHLGDHDPSGIDMTRDINDRLQTFLNVDTDGECEIEVDRVALNMDQVRLYEPPPNPAKVTDSRFEEYRRTYGEQSWELDAMSPRQIEALVRKNIISHIDDHEAWKERTKLQARGQLEIKTAAGRWGKIAKSLKIDDDEIDVEDLDEEEEEADEDLDDAEDDLKDDDEDEDDE